MATSTTIEAEIREGQIYLATPEKLPKSGKALLIVLDDERPKLDPERVRPLLGWLKSEIDAVQWKRRIRDEWDRHQGSAT
jgi:hypothetical protein